MGGLVGGLLGGRSIGTLVMALLGGWALRINPLTLLNLLSGGGAGAGRRPPGHVRFHRAGRHRRRLDHGVRPRRHPLRPRPRTDDDGPFYCPAGHTIDIDLGSYKVLKDKLGAPGDFAQAHVIAHEVGHHVQNLLGISVKVDQARQRMGKVEFNAPSASAGATRGWKPV